MARTSAKQTSSKSQRSKPKSAPKTRPQTTAKLSVAARLHTALSSLLFERLYVVLALLALVGTTTWWTLLGAHIEISNADQLVNAYLFNTADTFRGAMLPGAHTMLIKWPLFWLVKLADFTPTAFMVVTLACSLITVLGLAYVLHRIERRRVAFATLCLVLASVLWLVPAQSAPGSLLPVNMAMIATRNLEYLVYIAAITLFVRVRTLRQWRFWIALALLVLLFASDKLFVAMSIGAGVAGTLLYGVLRRRTVAYIFMKWLGITVIATVLASILLALINSLGVTHIVNSSASSPYGSAHGLHRILLGFVYALLGLATNFGANPAFDVSVLRDIPAQVGDRLTSSAALGFLVNAGLVVVGLSAVVRALKQSLRRPPASSHKTIVDTASALSLILLWSSMAMLAVFVLTDHYYAGDARYLTISLFAVFIILATVLRRAKLRHVLLVSIGVLSLVGIIAALPVVNKTAATERHAYDEVTARNDLVMQALAQHQVRVLVGDYWRVIPIQANSHGTIHILPLANCTQPRNTLTSKVWQPPLGHASFAYLLSLDRSLTDYPQCSLADVQHTFGHPNASVVVAGSLAQPKELLLFYDQGIHRAKTKPKPTVTSVGTVAPVTLSQIKAPKCSGETIMQVVAHQDDDLLFMNPDLSHGMQAGNCVRTVYVTAGDAGFNKFYWLSREQGSEAAYNYLAHLAPSTVWEQRTVKLANNEFVTMANPRGTSTVSLVFMHLPDGSPSGRGFAASHFESVAKLDAQEVSSIQSVDKQSQYSKGQLTTAMSQLMQFFEPSEIRTQANYISSDYPDHSDHMAVGRFAQQAFSTYEQHRVTTQTPASLKFYIGYPIHAQPANVTDGDLEQKQTAFFQYARFDGGVCHTMEQCNNEAVYGIYLQRQYQNDY